MNNDTNKQTIEYRFGYLRAAITGAMLLRNVHQMKAALGDALDHVESQSVKQNERKVSNDEPQPSQKQTKSVTISQIAMRDKSNKMTGCCIIKRTNARQ